MLECQDLVSCEHFFRERPGRDDKIGGSLYLLPEPVTLQTDHACLIENVFTLYSDLGGDVGGAFCPTCP
jgi:hypothetical protein